MPSFKPGDKVYLISNMIFLEELTVIKVSGGLVTVKNEKGGGLRVHADRLYKDKAEAERVMEENKKSRQS